MPIECINYSLSDQMNDHIVGHSSGGRLGDFVSLKGLGRNMTYEVPSSQMSYFMMQAEFMTPAVSINRYAQQ
jgi:hypothetical protein